MCLLHSVTLPKVTVLTLYALLSQAPTLSAAKSVFARETETKWKEAILGTHNLPRLRVGLPAFKWNEALADIARDWLKSDLIQFTHCNASTIAHSSKEFRTEHPLSPFYYLGETAVSKEIDTTQNPSLSAVELAQEAIGRWGEPMVQDVSYGRWGSECTLGNLRKGVAEGFFQTLWAATSDVGCEALFCGASPLRAFLLVCEYGPGGNVIGELPFSPTTATILGLSPSPCDGPLSDIEWSHWERSDRLNYPLPAGRGATSSAFGWLCPVHAMSLFALIMHAAM